MHLLVWPDYRAISSAVLQTSILVEELISALCESTSEKSSMEIFRTAQDAKYTD